jgi:alpha-L-rhamnosidase
MHGSKKVLRQFGFGSVSEGLLTLFVWLSATGSLYGQSSLQPYRLRADGLLHANQVWKNGLPVNTTLAAAQKKVGFQFPLVRNAAPMLYWELPTALSSTAYRIQVASSLQQLQSGKPDMWDSHKINGRATKVRYSGKTLLSGGICYWRVQVWDAQKKVSAFSPASAFVYQPADTTEPFSYYPLTAEIQSPVLHYQKTDGSYFYDFGKAAFGQVQLRVSSEKDDSIWIAAAEALQSPGNLLSNGGNIRYRKQSLFVKKGTHDYTLVWPADAKRNARNPVLMPDNIGEVFPFRYLSITQQTGRIQIGGVTRKAVFYPFDNTAADFISSDTVLNQVWELCKYSIKATSFSGYYVDGDRERLPYEADAVINQLSHYAVDAEYSIARRTMAYLLFHPTWPTEWSLQNILLAWNDYLYTGDDHFIRKYYPELQKKILMPLVMPNGLISTTAKFQDDEFLRSIHINKVFDGKRGLKDIVDWPQGGSYIGPEKEYSGETDGFVFTDYNAVVNAFYYRTLVLMHKISAALGKNWEAADYLNKAKEHYRSFQQVFRHPVTGLIKDGDTTSHTSLHANMFALAFGLIPEQDLPAVVSFIKSRKMACSVYGSQFLLDALYEAGEQDYALSLLSSTSERSWYHMVRLGSTISLEAWDKAYKPNLDWNHAWGAAPANIIVRKLMGVELLTPGADTIRIKPQMGSLRFAKLRTPTIKGEVAVAFERTTAADLYQIRIPGGTLAEVLLPIRTGSKSVLLDGKKIVLSIAKGYYRLPWMGAGKHQVRMQ